MRWKLLDVDPPVTYAVALQTDQEVEPASLTAIGAFSSAVLG